MTKTVSVEIGTRIYYTGDQANRDGFGTVRALQSDNYGRFVTIVMDDGRVKERISLSMIGGEYHGHCGTRFVLEGAYHEYRREAMKRWNAEAARINREARQREQRGL